MSEATKPKFKVPHTLVLLFGMIVLAYVLTYILPQGHFERSELENGRMQVVAGTYEVVEERENLWPTKILLAIPSGFKESADIIFFVFLVGGAFGVFRESGATDAAINWTLKSFGNQSGLLIASGMFIFAAGSSTIGMAEEYLPFVPILLALCIGLGLDAMTAIGILCIGYGIGYGVAVMNPFTVLVAQEVGGVKQLSGIGYRLALFLPFLAVGFHHVWSYARKVKADPSKSLVADVEPDPSWKVNEGIHLNGRHITIIVLLVATFAVLVYGIKYRHWYLAEMGAAFVLLAILVGIIGKLHMDKIASTFCHGASELTTTALLIGIARGIQEVLNDGQIIDTIVNGIATPLQSMGSEFAAVGMLVVQSMCNFFIPSGSGQAYVTMPIMAPLADLVGVSRQVAVLAYQMGDGFTNILVPTNAVLIGILAYAKIPYERWLKFILPFMLKIWILSAIALVVAVLIGY